MNTSEQLLKVQDVTKRYGTVTVLNGVSFTLERGGILGLVGENGAGKSTLAQCIAGRAPVSSGAIRFLSKKRDVYLVPQEFNLIPSLTVCENIYLGREQARAGILRHKAMMDGARKALRRLECDIDPAREAGSLSVAEKQMVEIAKAFLQSCALLIMDEPSTVLNRHETELMFEAMHKFSAHGGSIIYISHKLEEVRDVCNRIIVLRDGSLTADVSPRDVSALMLAQLMVGRELSQVFPEKKSVPADAPTTLEVKGLSSGAAVRDASFSIRRGEILGLAGLAGAGRTELAEALCALRRRNAGTLRIGGRAVRFATPSGAMKAGLAWLPEDRQGTALLVRFPLDFNITLASLKRYCRLGFPQRRRITEAARGYMERFRIKAAASDQPLNELSGGNQQKVAIAKGLDTKPSVFIFDEPTRGVDIGARSDIYHFIHELAAAGTACLLISSDLEEVIGMCSRVLVMRNGAIAGELTGPDVTEHAIMILATGVTE